MTDEIAIIKATSPQTVTPEQLGAIASVIGNAIKYPVAVILGILAVTIYLSNPNIRYKKTYSMQSLVDAEQANWPQITPVAGMNLIETDIDQGVWAMALTPMQFAKKYQLLQEERVISEDTFSGKPKITVTVRRDEAYRTFSMQLGRYFKSPERLNTHTRALFAVFAARINRDRDGATKLLLQISASAKTGKLDFSGTDALLAKHKDNKLVAKTMQNHAFTVTVMATLLQIARADGVLASADFLWLKPIDRTLWYTLNCVGRQVPFAEVAGIFAHWLAERKIGRKLSVPMVEEAVNGLELAIKEAVYVPDEV
jgi:intracellular multiplication protein IcmP